LPLASAVLYTLLAAGSPCSAVSPCGSGFCVDGVCCDSACGGGVAGDCQACSVAAGATADGTCTLLSGTTCSDGDACTQTDTCQAGACVAGSPVVCAAGDACHIAGTCDPATGACDHPAAPEGAPCDDGDGCTQADTCQGGVCTPEPDAGAGGAGGAGTSTSSSSSASSSSGSDRDGGGGNGGQEISEDSGCGCRQAGAGGTPPAGLALGALAAMAMRRWRRWSTRSFDELGRDHAEPAHDLLTRSSRTAPAARRTLGARGERMVWRGWKTMALAAGVACLSACGGGSSTGSGGAGTGGDSGTSSGTGGDSGTSSGTDTSSSSSSSSGTSTGTSTEPFEGIRCLVDGVEQAWPQGGLDGTMGLYVSLGTGGNLTFWGYPWSPPPEIRIAIADGTTPGTYACDGEGITHIWYFTADFGWTTVGGDCTITLTESAQAANTHWVGTFSATIPPFTDNSRPAVSVTEGTFNVLRP
jgi:MYXO-CTERM domain-containing protein